MSGTRGSRDEAGGLPRSPVPVAFPGFGVGLTVAVRGNSGRSSTDVPGRLDYPSSPGLRAVVGVDDAPRPVSFLVEGHSVTAACGVGDHATCPAYRTSCACLCHDDIARVVWRMGDRVVVTSGDGEVKLRPGTLRWARDLAETTGLRPVSGTRVDREEWVRKPVSSAAQGGRWP